MATSLIVTTRPVIEWPHSSRSRPAPPASPGRGRDREGGGEAGIRNAAEARVTGEAT